jgi:hypothetical protein
MQFAFGALWMKAWRHIGHRAPLAREKRSALHRSDSM